MSEAGSLDHPLVGWDPRRRSALERPLERLWETFAAAGGKEANLSDELISERRAEAEASRPPSPAFLIALDASALLSLVNREPGWDLIARQAVNPDTTISAVNYDEVLQKASQLGIAAEDIDVQLDTLAVTVSPFGRLDVHLAASFYHHRSGLS